VLKDGSVSLRLPLRNAGVGLGNSMGRSALGLLGDGGTVGKGRGGTLLEDLECL